MNSKPSSSLVAVEVGVEVDVGVEVGVAVGGVSVGVGLTFLVRSMGWWVGGW